MDGLSDRGERQRSLSPLFTIVCKLPFLFLKTHCLGSHPAQPYGASQLVVLGGFPAVVRGTVVLSHEPLTTSQQRILSSFWTLLWGEETGSCQSCAILNAYNE